MELGIQQEVKHNTQGKNTKYIKSILLQEYIAQLVSLLPSLSSPPGEAWKKRWASHVEKMPRASGGAFKI